MPGSEQWCENSLFTIEQHCFCTTYVCGQEKMLFCKEGQQSQHGSWRNAFRSEEKPLIFTKWLTRVKQSRCLRWTCKVCSWQSIVRFTLHKQNKDYNHFKVKQTDCVKVSVSHSVGYAMLSTARVIPEHAVFAHHKNTTKRKGGTKKQQHTDVCSEWHHSLAPGPSTYFQIAV